MIPTFDFTCVSKFCLPLCKQKQLGENDGYGRQTEVKSTAKDKSSKEELNFQGYSDIIRTW